MKRSFFISVIISIIIIITFGSGFATWEYDKVVDGFDASSVDDSVLVSGDWGEHGVAVLRAIVVTRDIGVSGTRYPRFAFVQYIDGYEHCVDFTTNGAAKSDSMEIASGDNLYVCKLGVIQSSFGQQGNYIYGDSIMFKYSENECSAGKVWVWVWRKKVD